MRMRTPEWKPRLAALLLFSSLAVPAAGHDFSGSFLDVTVADERLDVRYRLPVAELNLLFLIDQNLDGRYDGEEIRRALPQIRLYVDEKLTLKVDGQAVPFDPTDSALWGDEEDHLFIDFTAAVPLSGRASEVRIESRLFQELVSSHKTMVAVHAGSDSAQYALDASHQADDWQSGRTRRAEAFVRFLVLGCEHIFTGYDHVLFLVGLLLIGGTLATVVKIVTSFTVAHSLTLALAVFGHVTPNPTVIEIGIALSIAYVGVENLLQKQLTRRWHITFVFGLVHGFGFSHVLREMNLAPAELATGLFAFNLGVELGQIAIVALVFPVLTSMRQVSWHPILLKGASAMVLGFGVFWFFERLMA